MSENPLSVSPVEGRLNLKVEKMESFVNFGRSRPNDAAFDLYATEDVTILPGETKVIPTGVKMKFDQGWFMKIEGRSGLALKECLQPNGGVIDCTYRDEVKVILHHHVSYKAIRRVFDSIAKSPFKLKQTIEDAITASAYHVKRGDKIAQIVPIRIDHSDFEFVDSLDENLERGKNGFGSSGM